MKVIIAGNRTFNNRQLLFDTMDNLDIEIDEVVCGEARGADTLGKIWAKSKGIPVKSFPAEWDKFGRMAGPIRNRDMGKYADYLVAFWDGKSVGTKDMIFYMQQIGKHGKVVIWK